MAEIWAIRHPASDGNEKSISQGQYPHERGLSPRGFKQAERIAKFLNHFPLLKLWSSPLPRAMQLALIIGGSRKPPLKIFIEPGLMEITNGLIDGLFNAEAKAKFPEGWRRWEQNVIDHPCFPGGESIKEAAERGTRTLRKIARLSFPLPDNHYDCESGPVVVVTHGTLSQAALTSLKGSDLKEYGKLRQDNGCINLLRWTWKGLEVSSVNFTGHLGNTKFSPEFKI